MVSIFRIDVLSKFGGEDESTEGVNQGIIDHEDLIPRTDSDEDRDSIKDNSLDSNNVETKPGVFKQLSSYVVFLPLALGAIGLSVMTNTAGITTYLTSSFSSVLVQQIFEASFIGAAGLLPPTVTTTLYNANLTPSTSSENSEKQTEDEESEYQSESDEFEYRFNDSDFYYSDKERLDKETSFKSKKIDRKFVPITNSTVEGDSIEKDIPTDPTISTDTTYEETKSETSKTRSTEEKEAKAKTTEVQAEKTEEEKAAEEKSLKKELFDKIRKEGEKAGEDDVTVITTPLEQYENGTFQMLERYLFSARPELNTREEKVEHEYLPNLAYILQQVLNAYVKSGIELEGVVNGVKQKDFKSILEKLVVDASILKTQVMRRPYSQVLELLHMINNNTFYNEKFKQECEKFQEDYKARFLKEIEAYRKVKDEGNTDVKEPLSFDQYSAVMLNNRKEIIDDLAKFYTEILECDEVLVTAAGSTRDIRKVSTKDDITIGIRESSRNSTKYKYILSGSLIATLGIGSLCLSGFSVAPVIAYIVPSSVTSWLGIGTTTAASTALAPKTTAVGMYFLQDTLIHNLPSAIATLGTSTAAAGAYQAGQTGQAGQVNAKTVVENIQSQFKSLGIESIDTLNPPSIGDIYNNTSSITSKVIRDANLGTNPYLDAGFITKAWSSFTDYGGKSFGFIHNKLRDACLHVVKNPDGIAATTLRSISLATTSVISGICFYGVYNRFLKKPEEKVQVEKLKDQYGEGLKRTIEASKEENKSKNIINKEITYDEEQDSLRVNPITMLTITPVTVGEDKKAVDILLSQGYDNRGNTSTSGDELEDLDLTPDLQSSEEHVPSTSTGPEVVTIVPERAKISPERFYELFAFMKDTAHKDSTDGEDLTTTEIVKEPITSTSSPLADQDLAVDLNRTVIEKEPITSTSSPLADQDLNVLNKDEDEYHDVEDEEYEDSSDVEQNEHEEGKQEQKKNKGL